MVNQANFMEVGVFSLGLHGPDWYLSDHFRLSEFACKDGSDVILVHPVLVAGLEIIRSRIDGPIIISSAYRSHLHNIQIGGSGKSAHLWGFAADIRSPVATPTEIQAIAEEMDWGGIGYYPTFTHVDCRGSNRRWQG